ncbi:MAG: STM4015 family protein [Isosphaeraceae bacterium]
MSIDEHVEEFAGLPVRDHSPEEGLTDPGETAFRISVDYDQSEEGVTIASILERFLKDPRAKQVKALVIGPWDGIYDGGDGVEGAVEPLIRAAETLNGLRALFLGDVTYEECEISWINQVDVTPLLNAYPALEHFRVRGGNGLVLGPLEHASLRSLAVEAGGLPAEVVRSIGASRFPNLEELELWLGTDDYGGDATVEDLGPILEAKGLPKLKRLGLRNAKIADSIAVALTDAPVLRQIDELDLSDGTLSDRGALALLSGGGLSGLKRLNFRHHYVTGEVLDGLKATGIELDHDEPQDPSDEEDRYVRHSE